MSRCRRVVIVAQLSNFDGATSAATALTGPCEQLWAAVQALVAPSPVPFAVTGTPAAVMDENLAPPAREVVPPLVQPTVPASTGVATSRLGKPSALVPTKRRFGLMASQPALGTQDGTNNVTATAALDVTSPSSGNSGGGGIGGGSKVDVGGSAVRAAGGVAVPTTGPSGPGSAGRSSGARGFQPPRRSGVGATVGGDCGSDRAAVASPVLSTPATSVRSGSASAEASDTVTAPGKGQGVGVVDLTASESPAVVCGVAVAGVPGCAVVQAAECAVGAKAAATTAGSGSVDGSAGDAGKAGLPARGNQQLHQLRLSDMFGGRGSGIEKQVSTAPSVTAGAGGRGGGASLFQSQSVRPRPIGLARPPSRGGAGAPRGRGRG